MAKGRIDEKMQEDLAELDEELSDLAHDLQTTFTLGTAAAGDPQKSATFKARLSRLDSTFDRYLATYHKVRRLLTKLNLPTDERKTQMEQMRIEFYESIAKGTELFETETVASPMRPSTAHACPTQGRNFQLRLPDIDIPTFSGKIAEWALFRDTFKSMVHSNENLDDLQRLHYLRKYLKDTAASVLSGISQGQAGYAQAWAALLKRYDSVRIQATYHLTNILNFKALRRGDVASLEKFATQVLENAEALFKLEMEAPEKIIVAIIALRLLDDKTRERFDAKHGSGTELFTWAELSEFVQNYIVQLQSTDLLVTPLKAVTFSSLKSGKPPSKVLLTSTGEEVCCVCRKETHEIRECPVFCRQGPRERYKSLKLAGRCVNCFGVNHSATECVEPEVCELCGKKHHSWLHFSSPSSSREGSPLPTRLRSPSPMSSTLPRGRTSSPVRAKASTETANPNVAIHLAVNHANVLLGTAVARARDELGKLHGVRILIDSGSQRSFMTKSCARRLALTKLRNPQRLVGFGNYPILGGKHKVTCTLLPRHSSERELHMCAIVVDKICNDLPARPVGEEMRGDIQLHDLADPAFFEPRPIDILAGADLFGELLRGASVTAKRGYPAAVDTVFGWVLVGPVANVQPSSLEQMCAATHPLESEEDISNLLKRFWEVEELPEAGKLSPADVRAERHFAANYSRDAAGRFTVKLPFNDQPIEANNSKSLALRRFRSLEYKFSKDSELGAEYTRVLREYLERDYIALAQQEGRFFLPHQAVVKDSTSTKLRIVFDASAKTDKGSLNEHLLTGPKLHRDLREVMLSFRMPQIALSADICQMYLQIKLAPEDARYQHFFFRSDPLEAVREFCFKRLSFGLACSPFLALRVLRQLIAEDGSEFPSASTAILENMYVDDLLTGADSVPEAIQLQTELVTLLAKGGFELKKWCSNSNILLHNVPSDAREELVSFANLEDRTIKILGMQWEPVGDTLCYKVQMRGRVDTKRGIMSAIARMYDPLGYLAPLVFRAKSILQQLWTLKLDWDEPVPYVVRQRWAAFYSELACVHEIKITRCILPTDRRRINLVGFADASAAGYAAVIYLQVECATGACSSNLLYAKTKVAPLKTQSIPRLELCAALLLARSIEALQAIIHKLNIDQIFLFTDSTIVLAWLNLGPHLLKTFVANRVARITELVPETRWRHVSSTDNAADVASRGLEPSKLNSYTSWWHGPAWLARSSVTWPMNEFHAEGEVGDLPETKELALTAQLPKEPEIESSMKRFSSFTRMVNAYVYVLRFVHNTRNAANKIWGTAKLSEVSKARESLIRLVQRDHGLTVALKLQPASIRMLAPFADARGIVRVGGRLRNATLSDEAKQPILLPHRSHFVQLLVDHYHRTYMHAGPQLLMALLRNRYWILSARRVVRARVHSCVKCHRLKAHGLSPMMGDLPASRFEQGRPFLNVGIDFAGPFLIKESNRRKAALGKCYVCLFICFAIKAVHLDVVSALSTEAFLACLDRFVARRGLPSKIYSDNATNFRGASRQLNELYVWLRDEGTQCKIGQHLASREIEWHFIPPSSPHFGGLWEAGVKSCKFHLVRVLESQALTFEELTTVVSRIESILNSRPLHPLSTTPDEFEALTPGHFLTGASLSSLPEPDVTDIPGNRLSRWQLLRTHVQGFWRRWRQDYLSCLQRRTKWHKDEPSVAVGTMVVLRDPSTPPLRWTIGRIIEAYPGKDGIVRVVKVKTAHGCFTRAVTRISPLLPPTQELPVLSTE